MRIREVEDKDIQDVQDLLKELSYSASDMKSFKSIWDEVLHSKDMGILVAENEKKIVGYLSYSIKPQLRLSGYCMEIDELSISDKLRGQGTGSSLLSHAKEIAKARKVKMIIISTNRERESYKRGFYQKQGFKEKNSAWFKLDIDF